MPRPDFAEPTVRPLLKWAGGKSKLLEQLYRLMPEDVYPGFQGRLVEPFVGGAAMFLWLRPAGALLADSNPQLVNLYSVVANCEQQGRLLEALDWFYSAPHDSDVYYMYRSWEPDDPVFSAARLIYLNKNCFNGLYRLNRQGKFNVPFGRYKTKPRLYELENLLAVATALNKNVLLAEAPFEETLSKVRSGDFVYLDPPYFPLSPTSSFTGYTGAGFTASDQTRLHDAIVEAHRRTRGRARIMLSNSSAPELQKLYRNEPNIFTIHTVKAKRMVGATNASRGLVDEVAITNY